jgi:transcriptional accessory protein Tex/SPT6
MDFGAFVDIGGLDGLIHITQLSWEKIKHPSEVVKEGDSEIVGWNKTRVCPVQAANITISNNSKNVK